jgi:predicted N-acyltransferase
LPTKVRQRVNGDERRVEAAGVQMLRVHGERIRAHIPRIAELTCLNREKNGADDQPARIAAVLGDLLDSGVDLHAYLGLADGEVIASCVALRKEHRLFPKWAGFDYSALGERSGVYFSLVLDAPVKDSLAEGLRAVECGAGAHQAKKLRGCSSRIINTVLFVADESRRPTVARLQEAHGQVRLASLDGNMPTSPPPGSISLDIAPEPSADGQAAGGCCAPATQAAGGCCAPATEAL